MKLSVEGFGVVTPLGRGKAETAGALFAGSRDGLVERDDLLADAVVRVGMVRGDLPALPGRLAAFDCRNNRLALAALEEIRTEIDEAVRRHGRDRIAVVMGTSTSGVAEGEAALATRLRLGAWPPGFDVRQQEIGGLAAAVAELLGLTGLAYTVATACSSSAKVFASAQRLVDAGLCDAALVGGVDTLCRLTVNGFAALESIAADCANPFSRRRDGINIGEGAAMFLLGQTPAPTALLGVGESSDAHHVSAPDPSGAGAERSMREALAAAGLAPSDIDYVNLHGTATRLNDSMEGRAVAAVFGTGTPCSSTKGLTGHMLGAAGAAEAAFVCLALDPHWSSGALPPHAWDGEADPEIPPITLVTRGARLPERPRSAMLTNSFAFGGSNASLIFGRGW